MLSKRLFGPSPPYSDFLQIFIGILQAKQADLKLLIVEDEHSLRQSMTDFLSVAGYVCETASGYREALEKMDYHEYDCIILDIMLPGGSGLELLKNLKKDGKSDAVIIISAKGALEDRIEGLQTGADDYLTKPFHLSELAVRIAAILRRKQFNGQSVIQLGNITIDTLANQVKVHDTELELTQKEYQLFLFLVINKNRIVSKNAIAEHLWGDDMDFPANFDFIYSHIKNLRRKLVQAGNEDCIRSIYGAGYKLQTG